MKKFVAGVLVGLMISSGVAFASGAQEVIQAILSKDFKMTWNGAAFEPIDPVSDQRVYPIVYNDRTYIPARFIAEKAGVTVNWDSSTKTVIFTSGATQPQPTPTPAPQATPEPTPQPTVAPTPEPTPTPKAQGVTFSRNMDVRKLIEGKNIIIDKTSINPDGTMIITGNTIGGETAYTSEPVCFESYDTQTLLSLAESMENMLRDQGFTMHRSAYSRNVTYWTKAREQFSIDADYLSYDRLYLEYNTGWYMD